MRETVSPRNICNDLKDDRITKSFAIELLLSIIDGSEDPIVREECIEAFREIEKQDEKIFKLLESLLISDENPRIRNAAAKLIGNYYASTGIKSLEWALSHDKSPIVLCTIASMIDKDPDGLYVQLNGKLANLYQLISVHLGVIIEEARFFLDLENVFARNSLNYEMNFEGYDKFQQLHDYKNQDNWLRIENRRVVSLCLNFFNWNYLKERKNSYSSLLKLLDPFIYLNTLKKLESKNLMEFNIPNSIGLLKGLRKLTLRDNGIKNLPDSFGDLSYLEYLDLSYNNFTKIPDPIFKLRNLKTLNLAHNNIQDVPESVLCLESLEEMKINHNDMTKMPPKVEDFVNSLFKFKI